ncbi:valacyclovir hydrolase isoform X2 [Bacillus rossius redtenbacheri]|uniref:valacyclovir hydrolase isoform X2 n=1 Tax=Bacillus rossius redtenbacheri TaxID=93214 RepID=UPI002FDDBFCB
MHNIGRFALKNAFQSSCVHRVYLSTMKEKKVLVNGININYLKVGSGPKAVLCLPGALGSIWTDFKPQIENLSKSKFTLVAWDPPGYGKSRPPNRDFSPDFFRRDAGLAAALMKELGLDRFSLLGWSDGGITALVLAGTEPQLVDKMVVVGANAYIVEEELKMYPRHKQVVRADEGADDRPVRGEVLQKHVEPVGGRLRVLVRAKRRGHLQGRPAPDQVPHARGARQGGRDGGCRAPPLPGCQHQRSQATHF